MGIGLADGSEPGRVRRRQVRFRGRIWEGLFEHRGVRQHPDHRRREDLISTEHHLEICPRAVIGDEGTTTDQFTLGRKSSWAQ